MKRLSKKIIGYRIFLGFFISLFPALLVIIMMETSEKAVLILVSLAVFVLLFFPQVLFAILYQKYSGYLLTEKEVISIRGVLFRKKSNLLLSKIHAVNKKQGLFQKLFSLASLHIDSGSTNTAALEEVVIETDEKEIDRLYELIKTGHTSSPAEVMQEAEFKDTLFHFSGKGKFSYILLNAISFLLFSIILFFLISIVYYIFPDEGQAPNLMEGIMLAGYVSCGALLLFLIGEALAVCFKYHHFEVKKKAEELEISYGLFVRVKNTFKLSRIRAVEITSTFFQRLFGFVAVKLQVIGYVDGQENGAAIGVLIPLCRRKDVNQHLQEILPDYCTLNPEFKSKSYFPFISYWLMFTGILLLVFNLILWGAAIAISRYDILFYGGLWIDGILLFCLIGKCISALLEKSYTGIGYDTDKIVLYRGGFHQECSIIKLKNLISIEDVTTVHRKKKGIHSYVVHYRTNAFKNEVKVHMLEENLYDELQKLIQY